VFFENLFFFLHAWGNSPLYRGEVLHKYHILSTEHMILVFVWCRGYKNSIQT